MKGLVAPEMQLNDSYWVQLPSPFFFSVMSKAFLFSYQADPKDLFIYFHFGQKIKPAIFLYSFQYLNKSSASETRAQS